MLILKSSTWRRCAATTAIAVVTASAALAAGPAGAWTTQPGHAGSAVLAHRNIYATFKNPFTKPIDCGILITPAKDLPALTTASKHFNAAFAADAKSDHSGATTHNNNAVAALKQVTLLNFTTTNNESVTVPATSSRTVVIYARGATGYFLNPPYAALSLCRNSGWVGGTIDGDAYAFPVRSVAQIPTTTLAPPVNIPKVVPRLK
ncbi:hypothetical protein [Gordonia sp. (in: high G+C Gram-positive bacteria)]|uniref:hypothetical protein n=1 Tax=Gordonia sp. (in: high G+C Gram-positive bacteria) TaxID=84139 RepID=UPI001D629CE2|nr:hypothetical protein [Gordonia sp. (in: high G+C Gram-positive bacteria)]MCB1294327.1 hypothetical protein [Gordonia sp. (in: high G+C Gram-positive bacteria)]HMS76076.1 hypothetical protein [Gordonia sp. (in: high G+C Gram-positive bacteria)]